MKLPNFKSLLKVKMCVQTRSEVDIDIPKVFSIAVDAREIWLLQKIGLTPACDITCYSVQRSILDAQELKKKIKRRHDSETFTFVVLIHIGWLFTWAEEDG